MNRKTSLLVFAFVCLLLPTMLGIGLIRLVTAQSTTIVTQEMNPQTTTDHWLDEYYKFNARWRDTFDEVRFAEVSQGNVAVWWIYNAGFLIKTPKYVIAIDLYLPWVSVLDLKANDLDMIDVLLITHPHGDHYDSKVVQKIMEKEGALVVIPPSIGKEPHPARIEQLTWWESTTYHEINVTVIPSMHGSTQYANGYVVTTEDGIRIMHTDDNAICYDEMSEIGKEMRSDILLLNVGCGSADIYEPWYIIETARVVQAVQPKFVVLMHHYEYGHGVNQIFTYREAYKVKENLARVTPEVTVIIPSWGEQCIPEEWPVFRHDLRHTGYSTSKAPNTNETVWSYATGYWVGSHPAVVGGVVYIGSYDQKIYALNASTGTKIWNYTTGHEVFSSPAVADGVVFIGSKDKNVYALNATTGAKIWNYATGSWVTESPAVAYGMVFIGSWDKNVYALNASTGTKIWNYQTGDIVVSSLAVAYGKVFIGSEDHKVYALNASTGAKIWSYQTGHGVDSAPAVANGVVFIGSNDNRIYALNATTGAKIWSYVTGSGVWSSPAVAYGKVFIGSVDGKVYCLGGDGIPPVADAGSDQTVNEDTAVSFDGSGSWDNWDIKNFTWAFTDVTPKTLTGINPTYNFATPGTYTVTLNVTDTAGNWATDTVVITVRDTTNPIADAGHNQIVAEDKDVSFNANGSSDNVGIVNFTWDFGDEKTGTGMTTTHIYAEPSIYTITLNVSDAAGNWATDTVMVTVLDVTPPIANAGNNKTVKVGKPVTFDASSSTDNVGIVNYTWDFGDETAATTDDPIVYHTYTEAGTYTITLTVRDAAGTSDEDRLTITVETAVAAFPWTIIILGEAVAIGILAAAAVYLLKRRTT